MNKGYAMGVEHQNGNASIISHHALFSTTSSVGIFGAVEQIELDSDTTRSTPFVGTVGTRYWVCDDEKRLPAVRHMGGVLSCRQFGMPTLKRLLGRTLEM